MSNPLRQIFMILVRRISMCWMLCVLCTLSACKKPVEHGGKTPLVQVGDALLYQEDIRRFIPYGISRADSITFVQEFIRKWIEEQVLYEKAEHNVRGDGRIERMVAEYRRTLVMNNYERELLQQNVPEELSEEELLTYYNENRPLFILEEPVMKGVFIKAPLISPDLKYLKQWYKEKSEESQEQLEKYAFRNAVLYEYFYEYWIPVSELEGKMVADLAKLEEDFEKYRDIEAEDGEYCYLLHVEEYIPKGKEKPYDLARYEIVDLLANNRKVEFMNRVKKDLYNQSAEMGRINYYYKNETVQVMGDSVHLAGNSSSVGGAR